MSAHDDAPAAAAHAVPARKRAAATMLITDPGGRVLVVNPTYKPRWELPGGSVEQDESPHTAAVREIAEELGIDRAPGRLLALDYVPADPGRGRGDGLVVVFDGGTVTTSTALRLPAEELSGYAFVEPDQLHRYLPALQTRRALAALHAGATGRTVYLENGYEPPGSGR